MSSDLKATLQTLCNDCGNDRTRLMDILRATQEQFGCINDEAMDLIAAAVGINRVEVESAASFYAFLSKAPKGEIVIRLCNDVVDKMNGVDRVAQAFREELGIDFGQTTPDGKFTLEWAPCIGMSDQSPAALINDEVMTRLSTDKARDIISALKGGREYFKLRHPLGDGNNAHKLVHSMVNNNICQKGEVLLADFTPGAALANIHGMTPAEVIRSMKAARLRGRGGAGFPTGMKWEFTQSAQGDRKFVLCNADEGEPGTFKDRVLLTECADLLFEGMTVAGYAVGASEGVLYLRAEYQYLQRLMELTLQRRRDEGMLGENVCGKAGFNFDIRVQMGAGAYICGEETALISSCEGLRGDPKNRPPFPAQKGYLGCPTVVNNVETLCSAAKIMENGAAWFSKFGTPASAGTKMLSISGDCARPGVFEVPLGCSLQDVLDMAQADEPLAVQVGGPSGQLVGKDGFGRKICFDDLATGGSIIIFDSDRDLLDVVEQFMEFFVEESCGYCTPCRVGCVLMAERIADIRAGNGQPDDIEYLETLGASMKLGSRCGLGQTAGNPVVTSLANFRPMYEALLKEPVDGQQPTFDIRAALSDAEAIAGRESVIYKA
jgi:[NiFe] hydrogenase diaphorase moiety large subunit